MSIGTGTADSKCGSEKVCKCDNGAGATSTNCPNDGAQKCSSCTGKFFLHGVVCKAHTICDDLGRVQEVGGSNTVDAVCGADKKCVCGNGVGAVGTACSADGASKCVACSAGFYLKDDACEPHTDCDGDGKVQVTAGTGTTNAVCGLEKKCVCMHGTAAVGKACPKDGDARCVGCKANYFLDGITCKPHTNCDEVGKVQTSAATATKDAECGGSKQCTCANGGVGATGTACPKDKEAKCVSCDDKYFLQEIKCEPWTDCAAKSQTQKTPGSSTADAVCGDDFQCVCPNGIPATGALCPSHGSPKCLSCQGNYYLTGGLCLAWRDCDSEGKVETRPASNTADAECGDVKECGCDHGTGATGTACPKDGNAKCVKCDDSYWLGADHRCTKWTDCDSIGRITLAVGTSTSDRQCGSEKECKCLQGVAATGVKCPKHNGIKCIKCAIGYFLDGFGCSPWTNCDNLGRVEFVRGSSIGDAICGSEKTCSCNDGVSAIGKDCPKEGFHKCAQCIGKFYLEGIRCKPHTDCNALGKIEIQPANNIDDAKCGGVKECTCQHGLRAQGVHCPKAGDHKCVACQPSYWLDGHVCKPRRDCDLEGRMQKVSGTKTSDAICGDLWQCTCVNGSPAEGIGCVGRSSKCSSCDDGFFLDKLKCKPHRDCNAEGRLVEKAGTSTTDTYCGLDKKCFCNENGVGATGTKCPTHNTPYCGTCDEAYWLHNGKCRPHTLCDREGKIETVPGNAVTDAQCGRQKICGCYFGDGAVGRSCPVDAMHHCISCLPAYFLQAGKCIIPPMTTPSLRPPAAVTETITTRAPKIFPIWGIAIPIILFILVLIAVVLFIVCNKFRKPDDDLYHVRVVVPEEANVLFGQKCNNERQLVIPTTPSIKVGALCERVNHALVDYNNDDIRLEPVQTAIALPDSDRRLSNDDTLKDLDVKSGCVFKIANLAK